MLVASCNVSLKSLKKKNERKKSNKERKKERWMTQGYKTWTTITANAIANGS